MATSGNPSEIGFVGDLRALATELPVPTSKVLHSSRFSQLVVTNLKPLEQLGWREHKVDQLTTVQQGQALVVLQNLGRGGKVIKHEQFVVRDGDTVGIPAGVLHNITNMETSANLYLTTIYSPLGGTKA